MEGYVEYMPLARLNHGGPELCDAREEEPNDPTCAIGLVSPPNPLSITTTP